MVHHYTNEQAEFIKNNILGRSIKELTGMFNKCFELDLATTQTRGFVKYRGLRSEIDCRFIKGQSPPNKGTHIGGWEPTQFKKGSKPYNYMAVGTERVNGDGYVDIKIADPNKWRGKHILTWEKENGPVPKGHAVIFGDMDRKNFSLDNLILVSRKQLLVLNRKRLIQSDIEATKTGIIIANICMKIVERRSKNHLRKRG